MSKRINDLIPDEDSILEKTFVISPSEVEYLRDLDNVFQSFMYYQKRLMTNYLKNVSQRLGYKSDQNLEFEIDLKSPKRELTIKLLPVSEPPNEPPLHKSV